MYFIDLLRNIYFNSPTFHVSLFRFHDTLSSSPNGRAYCTFSTVIEDQMIDGTAVALLWHAFLGAGIWT